MHQPASDSSNFISKNIGMRAKDLLTRGPRNVATFWYGREANYPPAPRREDIRNVGGPLCQSFPRRVSGQGSSDPPLQRGASAVSEPGAKDTRLSNSDISPLMRGVVPCRLRGCLKGTIEGLTRGQAPGGPRRNYPAWKVLPNFRKRRNR
jgi:hypothetical protein